MKRMKLVVLMVAMITVFATGNALSADTASIDVTAEVLGTCSFNTTSYTMDFGPIDPTSTGDIIATVNLDFTCTNGTDWDLDDVSGPQTMSDGTNNLAYSIDAYTLTGNGLGVSQIVDVTGRIADTDYGTAVASTYSDTLTINILP